MYRFIFIAFLFACQASFGHGTDSTSSLIIKYSQGGYKFGEKRGMYSQAEIIEFTRQTDNSFKMTKHILFNKYVDTQKIVHIDTLQNSEKLNLSIPDKKLQQLLSSLVQNKDNVNDVYLKTLLKPITKKEIHLIAKQYQLDWQFESKYSDRADREILFKNIKSFVKLNDFIEMMKPTLAGKLITADIVNMLDILVINKTDTTEYHGDQYGVLNQPFCQIRHNNVKNAAGSEPGTFQVTPDLCVINLDINNSLLNILPRTSLLKGSIDLNVLKKYYIKWCLSSEDMWEKVDK